MKQKTQAILLLAVMMVCLVMQIHSRGRDYQKLWKEFYHII